MPMKKIGIPAYVISMPERHERFIEINEKLHNQLVDPIYRVNAFRGSALPDVATRMLTKNKWSINYKGALGCFMSHLMTWELLSASDHDYGFIFEDNAEIGNLAHLNEITFPADFDIIWCNERTCFPSDSVDEIRPINSIISFLTEVGRAPGTDGYILSKVGANKLIEWVAIDSLFTHVDLRLMAYSLTKEEARPLKQAISKISQNIGHLRDTYSADHKLIAFSLRDPICSRASIPSVRATEDSVVRSG
jgi:GR25 family glycosyltransferase involved in LPS biosynthesis